MENNSEKPKYKLRGCPTCSGDMYLDQETYVGVYVCGMCGRPETDQDPRNKVRYGSDGRVRVERIRKTNQPPLDPYELFLRRIKNN